MDADIGSVLGLVVWGDGWRGLDVELGFGLRCEYGGRIRGWFCIGGRLEAGG